MQSIRTSVHSKITKTSSQQRIDASPDYDREKDTRAKECNRGYGEESRIGGLVVEEKVARGVGEMREVTCVLPERRRERSEVVYDAGTGHERGVQERRDYQCQGNS